MHVGYQDQRTPAGSQFAGTKPMPLTRRIVRSPEGPRHSLESYCSQEHDAAFDALPDALEFGEVFACCAEGRLVEHVKQLKDVGDILLDKPEHLRRIRTLPLQQIADLGAARRPGPVGRELAVRVGFQDVIVVRSFVEDFRRLAGNRRSLEFFRAGVMKTMRRRGSSHSACRSEDS